MRRPMGILWPVNALGGRRGRLEQGPLRDACIPDPERAIAADRLQISPTAGRFSSRV
jgi:hypothetical protein